MKFKCHVGGDLGDQFPYIPPQTQEEGQELEIRKMGALLSVKEEALRLARGLPSGARRRGRVGVEWAE